MPQWIASPALRGDALRDLLVPVCERTSQITLSLGPAERNW
jgi:hypothetical protein